MYLTNILFIYIYSSNLRNVSKYFKNIIGFTILLLVTYSKVIVACDILLITYYSMYHVVMHMFVWILRERHSNTSVY